MSAKGLSFLGCAIRTVVVLTYIGCVVVGFYFLRYEDVDPTHLERIAARDLPAGYRLNSDSFTFKPPVPMGDRRLLPPKANPVGQYVLAPGLEKGRAISSKDLSIAPVIIVSAEKVKYFFSLQNQMDLSDALNADSHVAVCATTCVIEDARVAAIVCDGAPSSKCFAVLELSKDQPALISGQGKEDYRLVRRGN